MSQAGRTRYFARSARRGEEKNKALFFSSPRLALRARVALRAKYRVRPAWLIKRLSCRLVQASRDWSVVQSQKVGEKKIGMKGGGSGCRISLKGLFPPPPSFVRL